MKVGIMCEESQAVCAAFRERGHEAYSYDLQPCSGGHPEWHRQGDIMDVMDEYHDLIIFHPVCKYLTNSGVRWLHTEPGRWEKMEAGCEFFNLRHKFNCKMIGTENPIPHKYAVAKIGMYDQLIQPWQFGHGETKATCLWLKNLPKLRHSPVETLFEPKTHVAGREQRIWKMPPSAERERERSKTFPGIAKAMAEQWG